MAITSKNIFYPVSTDQITPLESVFSTMASSIDAALPLSGSESVSFSAAAGSTQVVTVTFDTALSSAPDKIIATVKGPVSGSSAYIATITNSSTTSFTALIYRLGGSTGTQTINLVWAVMN